MSETQQTVTRPAAPLCRTIKVDIDETRYGSRTGKKVTLAPPPAGRTLVDAYLGVILPGKKVEHLGRQEMVSLSRQGLNSSSLFFQAVHACFADHHALTLRPEVLMHLIVHEVATTVKQNAEQYRSLFTRSPERSEVRVRHDGLVLGDPSSPWNEAIAMFDPALREVVPPGIMEHLLPPFTTATAESQAASLIAFMDAASPFYDYVVETRCGIPEVRLAGEPEDYRRIVAAAGQLAEVFRPTLGKYFDHLLPVLATIAAQAAGAPQDDQFWRSIYKFQSGSGSETFNGWLSAFVNFVQDERTGALVAKKDALYDWTTPGTRWDEKGLDLGSVPSQVSVTPFVWEYLGRKIDMVFAGGPLGIDESDGSLMPTLTYAVLHAE